MNRLILIAAFFVVLLSSEVVITALAAHAFDVCMADVAVDGESENDSQEKSEDDSKVEILLMEKPEEEGSLSKALGHSEKSIFAHPYLAQVTPPPKA